MNGWVWGLAKENVELQLITTPPTTPIPTPSIHSFTHIHPPYSHPDTLVSSNRNNIHSAIYLRNKYAHWRPKYIALISLAEFSWLTVTVTSRPWPWRDRDQTHRDRDVTVTKNYWSRRCLLKTKLSIPYLEYISRVYAEKIATKTKIKMSCASTRMIVTIQA